MIFDNAINRAAIVSMAVGAGVDGMPAARRAIVVPASYEIRKAPLRDIFDVLIRGFEDARASRSGALATAVIYPVTAFLLAGAIATQVLLPFLFPICAGFALLGPLATLWFVALSRERERTGIVSASGAAQVFNTPRSIVIKRLAWVMAGFYLAWIAVAGVIYAMTSRGLAGTCRGAVLRTCVHHPGRLDHGGFGLPGRCAVRTGGAGDRLYLLSAGDRP